MSENKEVLLSVQHLEQFFKMGRSQLKAVNDVSFDIYKGEVFGLVGESGCGKTTTGRSIIRLYDITGGSVYFKGQRICAGTRRIEEAIANEKKACAEEIKNLTDKQQIEERIAKSKEFIEKQKAEIKAIKAEKKNKIKIADKIQMIYQDPIASLDPRMTVRDIIAEGLIVQGEKDEEVINEKVYKVLDMVGLLPEHACRYPHEFSGGQRQRVGIARAIILQPELIIADEPISALDVSIQAQVINLLNDLRNELGLTIMFIAHDLSVVKYFSDRIAVMYFGNLVELASSDELFAHPLHPYTRSLLSAIPVPDPHVAKNSKRISYNPLAEHDYSTDKPQLREIRPGHFVHCNEEEFKKYDTELNEKNN